MTHLEWKFEDGGLWMEDRPSRFEDFIMPHQHLIHIFLFIHCHESYNLEDIVKLKIFHLRTIYNFFQVCMSEALNYEKFRSGVLTS